MTQYVCWPAATGVQRVLRHLADGWCEDHVEAWYGFIDGENFVTGPISALGRAIAAVFRTSSSNGRAASEVVRGVLANAAEQRFSTEEVEDYVAGYLLPEPNLRAENLAVAARLHESPRTIPFFIYYDALPLTQPGFFLPQADVGLGITRYHHALCHAENIAFISQAVREDFESRIARRKVPNGIVARPGADGVRRLAYAPPGSATFVTIGTVEPRKQHRLMLEAFEQLWSAGRDYRLVVIGAAGGSEQRQLLDRLRRLSSTSRVRWIEHADDEVVATELSRASAMLFPSEAEGYGLPPLEALAVGCPAIVAEKLPALEGLPCDGQVRLREVTVDALVSAIEKLAEPESNAAYRRATRDLRLPTWRQFVDDLCNWITLRLSGVEARRGVPA